MATTSTGLLALLVTSTSAVVCSCGRCSFGRLTSIESVDLPMGGTRMAGHNYATLLDVPAVFSAVPIDPRAVPTRTLITSPFATAAATLKRVERIKGDDDYIMQVEAMRLSNSGR